MDVSCLCRSCMKEVATEDRNFDQDTVKMFTFCTNIQVRPEEQLPRQFCIECTTTIQSCYSFVFTAREVDHRLKDMIGMVKPEVPETSHNLDLYDSKIKPEDSPSSDDNRELIHIKAEPDFIPVYENKTLDEETKTKHSDNLEDSDMNSAAISLKDEFKTYICTECSKGFVRKKNYENHKLRYHSEQKGLKEFKRPKKRRETVEELDVQEFPCKKCSLIFQTAQDRRLHKREVHPRGVFQCKHCDAKFAERQLLSAHMRKHVRPKQQFTCHYCNKIFKEKSRLLLHLHMHDDTLKPHLCDICGSRYSHKKALLNHQLVHSSHKPYTCDMCGYTCRQISNIRRHKRAHLNERKHQCNECGKGFNELSSLKKHMYAHTGERPYKCPNCDSCYKSSGKRKNHLIRVHGLDPNEIPRLSKDGGPARRYVTEETRTVYSLVADRSKKLQAGT